jgi:hypothetical protein
VSLSNHECPRIDRDGSIDQPLSAVGKLCARKIAVQVSFSWRKPACIRVFRQ